MFHLGSLPQNLSLTILPRSSHLYVSLPVQCTLYVSLSLFCFILVSESVWLCGSLLVFLYVSSSVCRSCAAKRRISGATKKNQLASKKRYQHLKKMMISMKVWNEQVLIDLKHKVIKGFRWRLQNQFFLVTRLKEICCMCPCWCANLNANWRGSLD